MKTTKMMIMALGCLALCGANAADEPVTPSPYEVIWDSPSPDCNGTTPLGNGEIALNAWIEPSGDLRFYIARTDSWDDSGRLVKVGSLRIKVGDGPAERTKKFRQVLTAKDGTLSASYGEGDARVELRLWVDANRPVICVEAQTAKPSTATAMLELWRNAATELPEKQVSDVLNCALFPEKMVGCVNPMPELAGLHSTTARLLALPEKLMSSEDRAYFKHLQAKLPPLPTTKSPDGKVMLAPAQTYKQKNNSEVPELYAVFPFRQITVGKPNLEWGVEALKHRTDKGASGWRQDDIFMAFLGEAAQAREYVVQRARSKHGESRFPTFWGPNFDWIPDQDHGSVLLIAMQSMQLQADGRTIYLLPAWPKDWDCKFKLHAPYNTTVEGVIRSGKVEQLKVTPASRAKDVVMMNEKK